MGASDCLSGAIVIGSGWGAHAARAISAHPQARLHCLVGRGSDRTLQLAAELKVPWLDDIHTAVERYQPAVAVVAVGATQNASLLRTLFENGVSVLCAHPVVQSAEGLRELLDVARACEVQSATDYTLRSSERFHVAAVALGELGAPLRITIESPSATLIMGLDLALGLGGEVRDVVVSTRYPESLRERRARSPRSFGPTVMLEHASGCVTTVAPSPHAEPHAAYRGSVSCERGRVDFELPGGSVRLVRPQGGAGVVSEELIAAVSDSQRSVELYGIEMRRLVGRFFDAISTGAIPFAPLYEELERRRLWEAIKRSADESRRTRVAPDAGH